MKGKVTIVLLLVALFVSDKQSFAIPVFSGGIPERVNKRGLRVSCWVICEGTPQNAEEKLQSNLNNWAKMYLQERLKGLKLVDDSKTPEEVLKTVPHLTISFRGEGIYELAYAISVEANLYGYDVIVEGVHGRYQFWWGQNTRHGGRCDLTEFRELVRPILGQFIYQYLTGNP